MFRKLLRSEGFLVLDQELTQDCAAVMSMVRDVFVNEIDDVLRGSARQEDARNA